MLGSCHYLSGGEVVYNINNPEVEEKITQMEKTFPT